MNNIEFTTKPIKNPKRGHAYIIKDGRVALYLGKDSQNRNWFYRFGAVLYKMYDGHYEGNAYYQRCSILSTYEYQSICDLIDKMLRVGAVQDCLYSMSGLPILYGDLGEYEQYKLWALKNQIYSWFPRFIESDDNKKEKIESGYTNVKAKDLVVGDVYVGGLKDLGTRYEGWRNTFVYAGRRAVDNYFVWVFIGSIKELDSGNVDAYLYNGHTVEATKSNKKVYVPVYFGKRHIDLNAYSVGQYLKGICK